MRTTIPLRLFLIGLTAMMLISIVSAFAAGISVPDSNVGHQSVSVSAEDIKPPACASLYLTNVVSGSGTLTGTQANDLMIGSAGADIMDGQGGDDCILGGQGDDQITGSDGNDICIGSSGTDTFATCEGESQ
jgi:hypothetical protein